MTVGWCSWWIQRETCYGVQCANHSQRTNIKSQWQTAPEGLSSRALLSWFSGVTSVVWHALPFFSRLECLLVFLSVNTVWGSGLKTFQMEAKLFWFAAVCLHINEGQCINLEGKNTFREVLPIRRRDLSVLERLGLFEEQADSCATVLGWYLSFSWFARLGAHRCGSDPPWRCPWMFPWNHQVPRVHKFGSIYEKGWYFPEPWLVHL